MKNNYKKITNYDEFYCAYTIEFINKYNSYFLIGKVYDYNNNQEVHSQYIAMSEQKSAVMSLIGSYQEGLVSSYLDRGNNYGLQYYVHRGSSLGVENETSYYAKKGVHLF